MYKVYAYDYPQCGAGLYPLLNCKIIELSDDYQPRKDGNTGYDVMVLINPGKIALAKYRKDDIRKEFYYVLIVDEDVYTIEPYEATHRYYNENYERIEEVVTNFYYTKNNEAYEFDFEELPLVFRLVQDYHLTCDVDEKVEILEEINNIHGDQVCAFYSANLLKCAICPSVKCSECSHFEPVK
jgi:hypothetical protein